MSTFAYEYYKRNVAVLEIGLKKEDTDVLVKKGDTYTTDDSTIPTIIKCLYEKAPQFGFEGGFNAERSELLTVLNTVRNAWNAGKKSYAAIAEEVRKGGLGLNLETLERLGEATINAIGQGYEISAVPEIMRWGGAKPISFSVKLIFIDKNGGPVYFDKKIQTLLALVNFQDVAGDKGLASWVMKGPIGFNGTVTKINQFSKYLDGSGESDIDGEGSFGLHSLTLYKGDGDNAEPRVKVLDLHKILVVTKVDLQMSEQLFDNDKNKKRLGNLAKGGKDWQPPFPAYKWITANVSFSTVCPLPSPLTSYKTNVSNLYGLRP